MPAARTQQRILGAALAALASAAILVATLYHPGGDLPARSFTFVIGPASYAEIVQNLLLFIPLGVALHLLGVRPLVAVALGTALSLGVELAQQWIPGRDPTLLDVLCNGVSTAAGVQLARAAPRWICVPPPQAAWQSLTAALLALGAWLGLGLELAPNHTIGDGWEIIFDSGRIPGWSRILINGAWIAAGWLAVTFWTRRHPASGAALALAAFATLAGPHFIVVQPTPPAELIAAALGAAAGLGLRRYCPALQSTVQPEGRMT